MCCQNRFLHLKTIGTFQIYDNEGNGGCLFRAVAQALSLEEQCHDRIRSEVVDHIEKHWSHFGPKILAWSMGEGEGANGDPLLNFAWADPISWSGPNWFERVTDRCCYSWKRQKRLEKHRIKREYLKRMRKVSENGTTFELWAAADLYGFHFDYVRRWWPRDQPFIFEGCRTMGCQVKADRPRFVFHFENRRYGKGHWEFMKVLSRENPEMPLPLNRKLAGKFFPADDADKIIQKIGSIVLDDIETDHYLADSSDDRTGCWSPLRQNCDNSGEKSRKLSLYCRLLQPCATMSPVKYQGQNFERSNEPSKF